jgi:hypothetical protein
VAVGDGDAAGVGGGVGGEAGGEVEVGATGCGGSGFTSSVQPASSTAAQATAATEPLTRTSLGSGP